MRIDTFEIIPVSLRFESPFVTSGRTFTARQVLRIRLRGRDSASVGEIAPLHNFGSETLKDAFSAAASIGQKIINTKYLTLDGFRKLISNYQQFPAAISGIEQAYYQLYFRKYPGRNIESLFGKPERRTIPVNAVIGQSDIKESINRISRYYDEGIRVFKIKVGGRPINDELVILNSLRKRFPQSVKIRLDANGTFTVEEAIDRLKQYADFGIDYIEQPVKNPEHFARIREHVKIPIAADESVRNFESARYIIENKFAQVLIIKPALFGSIFEAIKLIKLADEKGIKTIVTSSLDSELGVRKAVIASMYIKGRAACGLMLPNFINSNEVESIYPIIDGKIRVRKFSF